MPHPRQAATGDRGVNLVSEVRAKPRHHHRPAYPRLNLGCGSRSHPEWVNVEFLGFRRGVPEWLAAALADSRWFRKDPTVVCADVRCGIPFENEIFEVVYHSHLLEHLDRERVRPFLLECRRVLRPGGILRIVVPDLERIVTSYLQAVGDARRGIPNAAERYDWAMLELFDQMVRTRSGGEMGRRLGKKPVEARAPANPWRAVKRAVRELLLAPPPAGTGELHRWMYDEYSLTRLLRDLGFDQVRRVTHLESEIPRWLEYRLDTEPDGRPYKPGSLFVECRKGLIS